LKTKDKLFGLKSTLNINGNLLSLETPKVMGILNVTPDSFYAESRVSQDSALLQKAEQMVKEGADILDIGGYSTRPGADEVSVEEELKRVTKALDLLQKSFPEMIFSVDTFRAEVAKAAIDHGAHIINDVSGGNLDDLMFATVADLKVPYILMHMRGTPQTMKSLNQYSNLLIDISKELNQKYDELKALGVSDVIIDPGFGFAKSIDQNYELLQNLDYLLRIGCPILAGISRKSMIYKTLEIEPNEALNGTTALHMVALQKGAIILRVHDVKEAVEAVKLNQKLTK